MTSGSPFIARLLDRVAWKDPGCAHSTKCALNTQMRPLMLKALVCGDDRFAGAEVEAVDA